MKTSSLVAKFKSLLSSSEPDFLLDSAVHVLPHPDKVEKGGEDAYFLTPYSFGIADGVSSMEELNIDPADYPKKLVEGALENVSKVDDPKELMRLAHKYAKNTVGASTFCIICVKGTELKAANLGDSGFLLIRNKAVVFKTEEQQHSFNCPYQLGSPKNSSTPDDCVQISLQLQDGDIIVTGSDGLFDNLFKEDILALADPSKSSQEIADILAKTAQQYSFSHLRTTPFSTAARRHGKNYRGGKLDDICVIVTKVEKNPSKNDRNED